MAEFYSATVRLFDRFCDPVLLRDSHPGACGAHCRRSEFGHMMTKTMLAQEWSMSIDQAIEAEAQAQAICMKTADFERAYRAFVAKEKPKFEGN